MSTFEDLVSRAKVHTRCILGRHPRFRFHPRFEIHAGHSNLITTLDSNRIKSESQKLYKILEYKVGQKWNNEKMFP